MRPMGRPRKEGSKDLPPGLYIYPDRNPFIKMAEDMQKVDLGPISRKDALRLYWEFRGVYDKGEITRRAVELAAKLEVAATEPTGTTVAGYTKKWREQYLPKLLKKTGKP